MEALSMAIALFGGLGLFLYGMKMMGDGLENASGEKLKTVFDKITSNPIKGVLTGALVTVLIQSSSATTVMVVGFVNAGLMNLYQAAAVIMGANIGTTITAQIISLNLDSFVPLILGIGSMIVLFAKGKKHKEIGHIVLGFGILFLGMHLMKDAMSPLQDSQAFISMMTTLEGNKFLGLLTGLVMTAIIQSSSASTGILIALASTGQLNLDIVMPILFGCNIGTCVTALLSSIGTSRTAKKAAVMHLTIKIVGTIIFLPLMGVLIKIVIWMTPDGNYLVKRQIANAHTLFNLANTVVLLPFIKYLVSFVNRIIPGEDDTEHFGTKYIDDRLLETPVIALGQAEQELARMGVKAKENLELAMSAFIDNDEKLVNKVYENEKLINMLEDEITQFVVKISKSEVSELQMDKVNSMFHLVNDIERIGDHAENLAELASEKINKRLNFSDGAKEELREMYKYTLETVDKAIKAFEEDECKKANEVIKLEDIVDSYEKKLRQSHIRRLNDGVCNATVGAIFLDAISNLERISDHSTNIAQTTLTNCENYIM